MENLCPYCKTPIRENDAAACPACNTLHHASCWEANGGCSTVGCPNFSGVNSAPVETCQNCSSPLAPGQLFCANCGAAKVTQIPAACSKCGAPLAPDAPFCTNCGQKADIAFDPALNSAISQFNAGIDKKKKSKKVPIIILSVALALCMIIGIFAYNIIQDKNAEKAKKEYIANAEEFLSLSLTAGANLEDISLTILDYWYDNIWYDMHGYDINDAIREALDDKSYEISDAEDMDEQLSNLYSKLKYIPEDIADEDRAEIEEIRDAVVELYEAYTPFYTHSTDPSGSYNSYKSEHYSMDNAFVEAYKNLNEIMN